MDHSKASCCVAALVIVVEYEMALLCALGPNISAEFQVYHPVTFALFNVMFYSSVTELTNHRERTGMKWSVSDLRVYIFAVYSL